MLRRARQSNGFERTPSQRNTPTYTVGVSPTTDAGATPFLASAAHAPNSYRRRPRRRTTHRCDAFLGVAKRTLSIPADEPHTGATPFWASAAHAPNSYRRRPRRRTTHRCDAFLGVATPPSPPIKPATTGMSSHPFWRRRPRRRTMLGQECPSHQAQVRRDSWRRN